MDYFVACDRCGHIWRYKGSKRYPTCPKCGTSRKMVPVRMVRF